MDQRNWLAEQFEANRSHLRSIAYRMLGSLGQADDAVRESWLHLFRAGTSGVKNLGGWLTTGVARVCLDMLGWLASSLPRIACGFFSDAQEKHVAVVPQSWRDRPAGVRR